MKTTRFEGETLRYTTGPSGLGVVLVAASSQGVCALFLGEEPEALFASLRARFPKAELLAAEPPSIAKLKEAIATVDRSGGVFDRPLDLRGTPFQQQVWAALRAIPAGQTTTYGEIARSIGRSSATRAVAQACGANPVAVIVPCHRVVANSGALSGYRWGVERKRALLQRESCG